MIRLRVYIDTSVVGGCQDEEFSEESQALFQMAYHNEVVFLVSDLLLEEVRRAPLQVQRTLLDLPHKCVESIQRTEESLRLCRAYLAAGAVTPHSENDAHHVALATVARADVIVS